MSKVSVVGLGKLGACTAACFASKGHDVVGVDVNRRTVDLINAGQAPVVEPGLQELITAAGRRLRATEDFGEAIDRSDATFLITPTPGQANGTFSDQYLRAALEPLGLALRDSRKPLHSFVITSTVSPGTTEESLIPLIETMSHRKLNAGFTVCYNPEFIALGSVIRDFLNPDLLLIGESRANAGDQLLGLYETVCENRPHTARMSIVSAEITKLSLNAYVTMKISFANTLANICEQVPGAEIDAITRALGADRRIGPAYLRAGLAFGGPCFPRDNQAFVAFARKYDCGAPLAESADRVNDFQLRHLTDLVLGALQATDGRAVSVLGLAYKPGTPVVEESAAMRLVEELLKAGVAVSVYDPLAAAQARAVFGDLVQYHDAMADCLASSQVWVLSLPLEEFKGIDDDCVKGRPTTIIDCWRLLDPGKFKSPIRYIAIGGADRPPAAA